MHRPHASVVMHEQALGEAWRVNSHLCCKEVNPYDPNTREKRPNCELMAIGVDPRHCYAGSRWFMSRETS